MMKKCFSNKSKQNFKVLLVYPNLPLMLVPPLAIAIFTRRLKIEGYQVELFDTTGYVDDNSSSPENRVRYLQARNFDYEKDLQVIRHQHMLSDFKQKVLEFQPDCMIVSVVEDAFYKTISMLKVIIEFKIPHIIGGVFPTAAPNVCMKFDEINLIGIGEGENTIIDFTETVRLGSDISKINGTWYKDDCGTIHKNPILPLVDLNLSVPDFSLFSPERFNRPMGGKIFKTIPIETYRGCPFSCTFCNSPMQVKFSKCFNQGNFMRRKSIKVLRSEILELIELHEPEFIYFIDDSFTARPISEIEEFCKMYSEFQLPFWFNTRPEICSLDMLKKLKDIGCYRISYGVECGNERFRKEVLKRHVANKKLLQHFADIANSGIPFSVNTIIGFPYETRELIFDTIELVRQIKGYDTITVSMFTPYHGTELRKVAEEKGWLDPDSITIHTTARSMLDMPPPYVNKDDLDQLMRVFTLYCYFPKSDWEYIKRAEINDDEGNRLLNEYAAIYKRKFLKKSQDDDKEIVQGGTGCKSNEKDSIRSEQIQKC